jgi:hypothetical protein
VCEPPGGVVGEKGSMLRWMASVDGFVWEGQLASSMIFSTCVPVRAGV